MKKNLLFIALVVGASFVVNGQQTSIEDVIAVLNKQAEPQPVFEPAVEEPQEDVELNKRLAEKKLVTEPDVVQSPAQEDTSGLAGSTAVVQPQEDASSIEEQFSLENLDKELNAKVQ
jgi:hypothetical protein